LSHPGRHIKAVISLGAYQDVVETVIAAVVVAVPDAGGRQRRLPEKLVGNKTVNGNRRPGARRREVQVTSARIAREQTGRLAAGQKHFATWTRPVAQVKSMPKAVGGAANFLT
jgi:hypothetical protein